MRLRKTCGLIFLMLFVSGGLLAQPAIPCGNGNANVFYAFKETALVAAAEVITVQRPANTNNTGGTVLSKIVCLDSISLWSTVATTFTLEKLGTGATTTALVPVAENNWTTGVEPTAFANFFSASNVGMGTVIAKYDVAAGGTPLVIDMTGFVMSQTAGSTQNFSIRSSSITGTVRVGLKEKEQ